MSMFWSVRNLFRVPIYWGLFIYSYRLLQRRKCLKKNEENCTFDELSTHIIEEEWGQFVMLDMD